ncbi:MAG: pantoate--beta-alanine ligase [Nocardioides sp.]
MGRRPALASTRTELAEHLSAHSESSAPAGGLGRSGDRVGFVPTMGALHEGHASLMAAARAEIGNGPLVVSVFVNPLQFGAGEDLERYPRTLDADLDICAREGVDVVFAPGVDEVYPGGEPQVSIDPGPLAEILEGRTRPGHFRGVLTVVAKLFGLVRPDVAVFGQKDYQQLVLIRRMTADLCQGIEVVGAPTLRESDGLALSSRNRFLDPEQRFQAAALNRTLQAAAAAASYGVPAALEAARAELRDALGVDLDYLEITSPDLSPLPTSLHSSVHTPTEGRILIAARVGTTRLIDNLPLTIG